jgi:hypothetical protein
VIAEFGGLSSYDAAFPEYRHRHRAETAALIESGLRDDEDEFDKEGISYSVFRPRDALAFCRGCGRDLYDDTNNRCATCRRNGRGRGAKLGKAELAEWVAELDPWPCIVAGCGADVPQGERTNRCEAHRAELPGRIGRGDGLAPGRFFFDRPWRFTRRWGTDDEECHPLIPPVVTWSDRPNPDNPTAEALTRLTPLQRAVWELLNVKPTVAPSFADIADAFGTSRQAIRQAYDRAAKALVSGPCCRPLPSN